MVSVPDLRRYQLNRQSEVDAAFLYDFLAERDPSLEMADIYRRLADTERRHADFWAEQVARAGGAVGPAGPGTRARILARLGRWWGPSVVMGVMVDTEWAGRFDYDDQPEAAGTRLPADERSHARLLGTIAATGQGIDGRALARLEGRHRLTGQNALRAAVLGANDGLVSNLSLVMAVAGANLPGPTVLITGLAGLLAGAISMALGEWISVQSGRELVAQELETERDELKEFPEEEQEELVLIYQAKGIPEKQARALAEALMTEPELALETMAREELGVDPEDMGGSPWTAAGASFLLFALGALLPVIPFMFLEGLVAAATSMALSGLALFTIGAAITLLTGRPVIRSGVRQTAFGLVAAVATFGIGRLLGVSLTG